MGVSPALRSACAAGPSAANAIPCPYQQHHGQRLFIIKGGQPVFIKLVLRSTSLMEWYTDVPLRIYFRPFRAVDTACRTTQGYSYLGATQPASTLHPLLA